jgi:hypothetical protein
MAYPERGMFKGFGHRIVSTSSTTAPMTIDRSAAPCSSRSKGGVGSSYDVLGIWHAQAERVSGPALDCGHFLAEEQPEAVAFLIRDWLSQAPLPPRFDAC